MDVEPSGHDKLASILSNRASPPCRLSFEYLRNVTKNFSDERFLGEGGFSKVYKGVLQNGEMIAVKKLKPLKPGALEKQFENEVYHLMRINHQHVIRLVGYCYETQNECVEFNGNYVFAEMQQRLLCFEYLSNGGLDGHLSGESSRIYWDIRFKIIKGVCLAIHYLHEDCQSQRNGSIIHLDLKPANILLDDNMMPKVADFGLSRFFDDNKTHTNATILTGSIGYMAPEYIYKHEITKKADIYSLGVIIIEIITGARIDPFNSTSYQESMESVFKRWGDRLKAAPSQKDWKQIKCCLDIGFSCVKVNRNERPTIREIVKILNGLESTYYYVNNEDWPRTERHKDNEVSTSLQNEKHETADSRVVLPLVLSSAEKHPETTSHWNQDEEKKTQTQGANYQTMEEQGVPLEQDIDEQDKIQVKAAGRSNVEHAGDKLRAFVLKVRMHCHCDRCLDPIRSAVKDLTLLSGIEALDSSRLQSKGEVKIVTTADPEKLRRRLHKATRKNVDLILALDANKATSIASAQALVLEDLAARYGPNNGS